MDPNATIYTPSKALSTRKSSSLGLKRGRSATTTKATLSSVRAATASSSSSSTGTAKRPKRGQSQDHQGQSEEIDLLSQSTVAVAATIGRTQDTTDDVELELELDPMRLPPKSSAVQNPLFDDTVFDGDNLLTSSTADADADTAPPAYANVARTLFTDGDTQAAVQEGAGEASGDGKSVGEEEDGGDGVDSKHELTDTDDEEEKVGENEEVKMVEEGPDLPCFMHLDSLNIHKTFNICSALRRYATISYTLVTCIICVILCLLYTCIYFSYVYPPDISS